MDKFIELTLAKNGKKVLASVDSIKAIVSTTCGCFIENVVDRNGISTGYDVSEDYSEIKKKLME